MNEDTDGDPKPPETLADTVREIKAQPPVDIPPKPSVYTSADAAPAAGRAAPERPRSQTPAKLNFLPDAAVLSSEDIASAKPLHIEASDGNAPPDDGVNSKLGAFDFENDLTIAENAVAPDNTSSDTSVPAVSEEKTPSDDRIVNALPDYHIIGEAFNSYVFVETGESVLCIDKHAAHERIIFEQMKRNMRKSERVSQIVLLPISLALSAQEYSALGEFYDEITSCGFSFVSNDGKRTVDIIEYPAELEQNAAAELFGELVTRLSEGTSSAAVTREIVYEKALYQASCKAAIKAGRVYTPEHVKWVVEQLLMLPDIKFCPHGRPVAFEMTRHELEKQFKRV